MTATPEVAAPENLGQSPRIISFISDGIIEVGNWNTATMTNPADQLEVFKVSLLPNGKQDRHQEDFYRAEIVEGEAWIEKRMRQLTGVAFKPVGLSPHENDSDWLRDQFARFHSFVTVNEVIRMTRTLIAFNDIRNKYLLLTKVRG